MKLYGTKYGQSWYFETIQKIEKWMRRDQEKKNNRESTII